MGRTYVDAAITGPLCARTYNFLVDTGSAHLGLPWFTDGSSLNLREVTHSEQIPPILPE